MPARANLSGCLRSCCWSKEPLFGEAACFSWRSHHCDFFLPGAALCRATTSVSYVVRVESDARVPQALAESTSRHVRPTRPDPGAPGCTGGSFARRGLSRLARLAAWSAGEQADDHAGGEDV